MRSSIEDAFMQRIAPASAPFPEPVAALLARTMPPGIPPLTLFTTLARDARLFERGFYHTVRYLTNARLEPEPFAARFPAPHGAGSPMA